MTTCYDADLSHLDLSFGLRYEQCVVESTPMVQYANYAGLRTSLPTVEEVLDDHVSELGHDFMAYRKHVYRVANLCLAVVGDSPVELEKIAVATVFHDLGIWTNHTFDDIAPSLGVARERLAARGMTDWILEIEATILNHHQVTPVAHIPGRWSKHFGAPIGSMCPADSDGSACRARSSRLSPPPGPARASIASSWN